MGPLEAFPAPVDKAIQGDQTTATTAFAAAQRAYADIHIEATSPSFDPVGLHVSQPLNSIVEYSWGFYDHPSSHHPLEICYALPWGKQPQLEYALIRLGIHGGIKKLHVRDPKKWVECVSESLPGCMGVQTMPWAWVPTESSPSSLEWGVVGLDPGAINLWGQAEELGASKLAENINQQMDHWTLCRLGALIDDVAAGRTGGPLNWRIGPKFLPQLPDIWAAWRKKLITNRRGVRQFLSFTLATTDSFSFPASMLRVGPITANTCLLQGVIFALAIAVAVRKTSPKTAPRHNIEYRGEPGHLLGLELVDGREFQDRFATLEWENGYAFLATEKSSVPELKRVAQKFSESEEQPPTVKRRDQSNIRLVTRDDGFRIALADSPEALAAHLEGVVQEQDRTTEARLIHYSTAGLN